MTQAPGIADAPDIQGCDTPIKQGEICFAWSKWMGWKTIALCKDCEAKRPASGEVLTGMKGKAAYDANCGALVD